MDIDSYLEEAEGLSSPATLCHPQSGVPLRACEGGWQDGSGDFFPIIDGIGQFLDAEALATHRASRRHFYDGIAPLFDLAQWTWSLWSGRDLLAGWREALGELEITPNARVLEVGVGTCLRIQSFPESVDYYGVELSPGLLRRSRHNLTRSGRSARLFWASPEAMPFPDESFDVVFLCGEPGLLGDPSLIAAEMLRVAREGTKIVIASQTSDLTAVNPKTWLPEGVDEVNCQMLDGGRLRALSFRKPIA